MNEHYKPNHSDFLIHWTGKDIDEKYDSGWTTRSSSITNKTVTELYLKRLKSILKNGLWLTKDPQSEFLNINGNKIKRPFVARTCFTEYRLSSVRSHASDYGRLGIGFKRPFVLNRMGGPMIYYQQKWADNWFFPPHYEGVNSQYRSNDFFACFLKPMIKKESSDISMVYRYYDESEWRIIYSQEIEEHLKQQNKTGIMKHFKKPSNLECYINENNSCKPEYLIPIRDKESVLDEWFALIIYPSIQVKVEAESDKDIRDLLNKRPNNETKEIEIKKIKNLNYNKTAPWEKYNKVTEIELDACRNF